MANPNIVTATSILGKTVVTNLTSTSATLVLDNAASSNKVLKVNSLYVANVDGSGLADITLSIYSEDNIGGTATEIASTISVPPDSTLVIIDKDSFIYLEEDKSIGATASSASDLKIVCSYEEIS